MGVSEKLPWDYMLLFTCSFPCKAIRAKSGKKVSEKNSHGKKFPWDLLFPCWKPPIFRPLRGGILPTVNNI